MYLTSFPQDLTNTYVIVFKINKNILNLYFKTDNSFNHSKVKNFNYKA